MKKVTIRWQRLIDEKGQTCPRCRATGDNVQNAYKKLKKSISALGIQVTLKTEAIEFPIFTKDPLQSNRIWINGKSLEQWIEATVGQSKCCDNCAGSECRTLSIDQNIFEVIPEELIIRAGLLAAAELITF